MDWNKILKVYGFRDKKPQSRLSKIRSARKALKKDPYAGHSPEEFAKPGEKTWWYAERADEGSPSRVLFYGPLTDSFEEKAERFLVRKFPGWETYKIRDIPSSHVFRKAGFPTVKIT